MSDFFLSFSFLTIPYEVRVSFGWPIGIGQVRGHASEHIGFGLMARVTAKALVLNLRAAGEGGHSEGERRAVKQYHRQNFSAIAVAIVRSLRLTKRDDGL